MDRSKIIERLFTILAELDARESSGNSINENLSGISYKLLCSEAIWLLHVLKK